MSTTLRYRNPDFAPKTERQRGVLSRRTGPCLLVGLLLSLAFAMAGGGGAAFYEAIYLRAIEAKQALIRAPGARISGPSKGGSVSEQIRLQGILYGPARSLAVINEANCAPGERVMIRVGDHLQIIRCVEVLTNQVTIETADGGIASLRLDPKTRASDPEEKMADQSGPAPVH